MQHSDSNSPFVSCDAASGSLCSQLESILLLSGTIFTVQKPIKMRGMQISGSYFPFDSPRFMQTDNVYRCLVLPRHLSIARLKVGVYILRYLSQFWSSICITHHITTLTSLHLPIQPLHNLHLSSCSSSTSSKTPPSPQLSTLLLAACQRWNLQSQCAEERLLKQV